MRDISVSLVAAPCSMFTSLVVNFNCQPVGAGQGGYRAFSLHINVDESGKSEAKVEQYIQPDPSVWNILIIHAEHWDALLFRSG